MLILNNKTVFRISSRLLFIICIILCSASAKAQSLKSVFEYVSAEYKFEQKLTVIYCKNELGEIFQLQIREQDKVKGIEELFINPSNLNKQLPTMTVTKPTLVGKKFTFVYDPIGVIDPANPYCCYKILEYSPL